MDMKELAGLEKRPQYFSFFLECCEMIALLDNESAGKVIHAIADYFIDGEHPENLTKNDARGRRGVNTHPERKRPYRGPQRTKRGSGIFPAPSFA